MHFLDCIDFLHYTDTHLVPRVLAAFDLKRVQANRGQDRTAPSSHRALALAVARGRAHGMREMLLRCETRGPNFFGHVDRKHTPA